MQVLYKNPTSPYSEKIHPFNPVHPGSENELSEPQIRDDLAIFSYTTINTITCC